jgi:hypothetical protein
VRWEMYSIIINTWKTKNTPWVIKLTSSSWIPLKRWIDLLRELPDDIVAVPENYWGSTSLPRYYLLTTNDDIISVVGLKRNLTTRTKWWIRAFYSVGGKKFEYEWYHPDMKALLTETLQNLLELVSKASFDEVIYCIRKYEMFPC